MRQITEGNVVATLVSCSSTGKLEDNAIKSLERVEDEYFFYDENKAIVRSIKKLVKDGELIDVASISSTASKLSDKSINDISAHVTMSLVDYEAMSWFLDTYINRLIYEIKASEVKKLCEKMIEACDAGMASNNDISDFNEALEDHIKEVKQF